MKMSKLLLLLVIGLGLTLQSHNAWLYNPLHGFDGKGHIEYLSYITTNHVLPLPHKGWQFYQTPIYYLLSLPAYLIGGAKGVQFQNIVYYVGYLVICGLLIARLFPKEKNARLVATLTLAALPVVNYLVPMISNEYLNDTIKSIAILYMMVNPGSIQIVLLLVVGFYTKYSVLTLGPAYFVALLQTGVKSWQKIVVYGSIFALLITPVVLRNIYYYKMPLAMAEYFYPFSPNREQRDFSFYTDMSWVTKADLFQAHHYSFIGGTWNTFWHDGYQVTVPVVPYHKKALGLWLLGFPLTVISIMGWGEIKKRQTKVYAIGFAYLVTAIASYVVYNIHLPYPSELKAFFMSALPVIYAIGITSCYSHIPKSQKIIGSLLVLQFAITLSYFWIRPWWHVAF